MHGRHGWRTLQDLSPERRQLSVEELPGWRCGRALPLRAGGQDPGTSAPARLIDATGTAGHAPDPPLGSGTLSLAGHGNDAMAAREPTSEAATGAGQASRFGDAASEGRAVAMLNPDGSLAGIARLDPADLLRPRLVFDAAG
jgi:hypothetical protein